VLAATEKQGRVGRLTWSPDRPEINPLTSQKFFNPAAGPIIFGPQSARERSAQGRREACSLASEIIVPTHAADLAHSGGIEPE
jgi:hypothetical protein